MCNQQPISGLYDSKFLPHFKAAMSQDRLLLLIRFCRFDDGETRDEHKVNRYGHVCEICDTFHNHCRKLYRIGAYAFGVASDLGNVCPASQEDMASIIGF